MCTQSKENTNNSEQPSGLAYKNRLMMHHVGCLPPLPPTTLWSAKAHPANAASSRTGHTRLGTGQWARETPTGRHRQSKLVTAFNAFSGRIDRITPDGSDEASTLQGGLSIFLPPAASACGFRPTLRSLEKALFFLVPPSYLDS